MKRRHRGVRLFLVGFGIVAVASLLVSLRPGAVGSRQEGPEPPPTRATARPTAPVQQIALPRDEQSSPASTVSLVERPWRHATTGWQVLADFDEPVRDSSFVYGPLSVASEVFTTGISTYPLSEITYDLDASARRFRARVGITDDSREGAGSARFYVYGDEFLLFESGPLRAFEPAPELDVSVEGLRELRLVVDDAGDGSLGDYALWADPRLVTTSATTPVRPEVVSLLQEARSAYAAEFEPRRAVQRATRENAATAERTTAARALPDLDEAAVAHVPSEGTVVLANRQIIASFGVGGTRNGRLRLLRRADGAPILFDVSPTLTTRDHRTLRLIDMRADSVAAEDLRRVVDSTHGPATQAVVRFRPVDGDGVVVATLTVPDDGPVLELRLSSEGMPLRSVRYLDAEQGTMYLGDGVRYLSDRSHLYTGQVRPDGFGRRAPLELTKPALLWSESEQQGLLLSFFEYAPSPAWLTMQAWPGQDEVSLGVELTATLDDFGPEGTTPPPLTVELTSGAPDETTFRRFRGVTSARFPLDPWPSYARYQWGSWYVYGPGVSAAGLQRQMDLLSASFVDLGPWLFAIDAGWYVQYGREDAELTTVDMQKFPQGVRGVADAAHERGMNVILYLGTGFVHDSPADGGEWLALRGLIERYPEWLIPFQCQAEGALADGPQRDEPGRSISGASDSPVGTCLSPSGVRRYLLDYANPAVRSYLAGIVRDFFEVHGADGILLDGVADAEGQLIPRPERDSPNGPVHPLLPTLDLYRFIHDEANRHHPGAFLESGWLHPRAADPYLDVFWYGDDVNDADAPYPFAGFFQRLDYALFSRLALGQRPYLGTGSGDPNVRHARWRVQAAAALGVHATLSYDLGRMDADTVASFRADLAALDPFQGVTTYGPGLQPETFATTRDGVTYLGVVNRDYAPRTITVPAAAHGFDNGSFTALDVDAGTARLVEGDFSVDLPARSFRLLVLRRDAGVLWTDSVVRSTCGRGGTVCLDGIGIVASGPAAVPGFLQMATPFPTEVVVNGLALRRGAVASEGTYVYDDASGLLSLAYSHRDERRVEVRW